MTVLCCPGNPATGKRAQIEHRCCLLKRMMVNRLVNSTERDQLIHARLITARERRRCKKPGKTISSHSPSLRKARIHTTVLSVQRDERQNRHNACWDRRPLLAPAETVLLGTGGAASVFRFQGHQRNQKKEELHSVRGAKPAAKTLL